MTRYFLIDNHSGYIFADTADLNGPARDESPTDAARRLDESVGEFGRSYEETSHKPRDTRPGYNVYADVSMSDVIPAVRDGQDQETIETVERECKWVSFVECRREADAA